MSKKQGSTTKPKPAAKRPAKGREAAQKRATAPHVATADAPAARPQEAPQGPAVAPTGAETAKPKGKPTPAATGRTLAQDARLPAPGTVLKKTDRHGAVRCECTVEEAGIRYAGTLYSSISSAALAAAKDLGLKNKTQNGYIFWGLAKPPRPVGDPVEALERAWERYRERAEAVAKEKLEEDVRKKVLAAVSRHSLATEKFVEALK